MVRVLSLLLAVGLLLLSAWQLERAEGGLDIRHDRLGDTPATFLTRTGRTPEGWVIVSHGFAGSRQMMHALSLSLARTGLGVISIDSIGHGRHPGVLSPDVTRIEGTTAQLVDQMGPVIAAAPGPVVALLGHSMATDIILRAGRAAGIGQLVAISMYSETLSPDWPPALLVVSGQWESRLRDVALDAARMVEADVLEGETAEEGEVRRRTAVAPWVGHVGVLWSPTTARAARNWLTGAATPPALTGPWIVLLLGSMLAAGRIATGWAAKGDLAPALPARSFWLAGLLPLPLAGLGALAVSDAALFGMAGFAPLGLALAVPGMAWLVVGWSRLGRPGAGLALFALWSLAFALLLDRYGASFLPTGPRVALALALLPATLAYALGEAVLLASSGIVRRVALRLAVLALLGGLMFAAPARIGLTFTVLPVLVLFWLVFGTVARPIARRRPGAAGLGLGAALAWSIAASTPLFSA
ncbi:Alpha/beta hydrolase family protein [Palleronia salina]|uniref:Alpha/beta hydrolase family protein n=1 Tax=Palleronia salina TaxID=313368 RepID=A0A1M6KU42_9RHOB|nr:Alpha/beta hydrolase family protein [Palleronia salina]